jgi:hypothetical protein
MGHPARPTVIAVNLTASPVTLADIGVVVPASGTYPLSDFLFLHEIQSSSALFNAITADQIVLNDGVSTLSKTQSLNFSTGVASAQNLQSGVTGPSSSTANQIPKFGDSTGKSLVASAVRINASNEIDMQSAKIVNLATPTAATDAATKGYVDTLSGGVDPKESVRSRSDANVTLSGPQSVGGVSLVAGNRVLLMAQTNAVENGVWVVAAGAWSRSADMAAGSSAAGAFCFVEEGTYADVGYVCTTNVGADVVGTNALSFTQFSTFQLATVAPLDVDRTAASVGTSSRAAREDHKHDVSTAAPGANSLAASAAAGTATSLARSDHVHQSNTPPVNVTKAAAAIGTSGEPARADHKHDVSTAAPGATGVGTASAEGTSTALARADHVHQSNTAPVNVTKAAAAIGTSGQPARADHKHDVATAAPGATGVGTAAAEGTSTSLARADHVHQSNTPPASVTKSAAVIGVSGEPARADHKHDVATAAPGVTGVGTVSSEGASTSLARADHVHQSNTAPSDVTKSAAAIGTSGEPARADHKHDVATAAPAVGIGAGNTEGSATTLARSDHSHALRESSGPTDLTIGAIADGEQIRRSGATIVGGIGKRYPASATDPASPTPANGDQYFNTALGMEMFYDGSRAKWLSVETAEIQFGRAGNTAVNTYYRGMDNIVLSSTTGRHAEFNGTVVSLGYTRTDNDAATFEVTANGSSVASLLSEAVSGRSTSLNGDFNQGAVLAIRNAAGGNTTSNVAGTVRVRWRL